MNEDELKLLLCRDKVFLKRLYSGPNYLKNRDILNSATEAELNTLIQYLHFVANGKITIKKSNFNQIKKNNKLQLIRSKVEKENNCLHLLNSKRQIKLSFLLKMATIMPYLLYGLFNLI